MEKTIKQYLGKLGSRPNKNFNVSTLFGRTGTGKSTFFFATVKWVREDSGVYNKVRVLDGGKVFAILESNVSEKDYFRRRLAGDL